MVSLTIKNDVAEMVALEPFVQQFGEEQGLDAALTFQLQLALDEAVSNVVNYAYGEISNMPVTITADVQEADGHRQLVISLIDSGCAFNPLESAPEVDTQAGVEERPIGGLGIFLIRQMMDGVSYCRTDEHNVLTLTKKL